MIKHRQNEVIRKRSSAETHVIFLAIGLPCEGSRFILASPPALRPPLRPFGSRSAALAEGGSNKMPMKHTMKHFVFLSCVLLAGACASPSSPSVTDQMHPDGSASDGVSTGSGGNHGNGDARGGGGTQGSSGGAQGSGHDRKPGRRRRGSSQGGVDRRPAAGGGTGQAALLRPGRTRRRHRIRRRAGRGRLDGGAGDAAAGRESGQALPDGHQRHAVHGGR